MRIKNKEALLSWEDNSFAAVQFDSLNEAFTHLGMDFNSKPEFDLKNLRAWANYVLG